MPRTVESTVYKFEELSDKAKEKARAWFRDDPDTFWSENVIEDFETIAGMLGIEFSTHNVRTVGGKQYTASDIWWSGFWSQGDGACFEGTYRWKKGAAKAVKAHAPKDEKLHAIADGLQAIQKQHGYRLQAVIAKRDHHYSHSRTVSIEVSDSQTGADSKLETQETVAELLRDLMQWLYRSLEEEYEWHNADEQVDENITANEYEFTAAGKIA